MFMNENVNKLLFAAKRTCFISAARQGCEGLQYYHLLNRNPSEVQPRQGKCRGEPRQLGHHLGGAVNTRLSKDLSLVGISLGP